ncbi:MAG: biotin-dependent carboxyltransferase family protein [Umezawaea sp.]
MRRLTVLRTGPQALVQDLGRPGYAHLGVPPSGALDAPALRLANRLVGNPESAAGLEVLLGGLVLRAQASCTVVVTGPRVLVRRNGCAVGSHAPVYLAGGDVLEVGTPEQGLRCYLAVSGGIDVPAALGSRSTDLLSGIGPDPVRADDELPLGAVTAPAVGVDVLAPTRVPRELVVPVLLGPRDDWFDAPARQLRDGRWTVSERSNRVGMRLTGTALVRAKAFQGEELPSEGIPTGGVQVPADGQPVVFLADHPTTGGYPVIGVVPAEVLPLLAQARPGVPLEFRPQC